MFLISLGDISFYKLENKPRCSNIILRFSKFVSKFDFRGPLMVKKIPHTICNQIFPFKCGFGIGYGFGRKYRPIWISVIGIGPKLKLDFLSNKILCQSNITFGENDPILLPSFTQPLAKGDMSRLGFFLQLTL